jgi:hypothetical protein
MAGCTASVCSILLVTIAATQAQLLAAQATRPLLLPRPAAMGGQTRADFFKSLHESAKSGSGDLFAGFLQTFFMKCRLFADFCRLFLLINYFHAHFCRLFADSLQQMIQVLRTSCTLILYLQTFCRLYAHILQLT